MHNNFYFLRQLSAVLDSKLKGSVVSECFSQSKDELILRFEIGTASFVIRASLLPGLSCVSFPENFQRARKNSVDLFPNVIGRRTMDVRQFNNERSFSIRFSEGIELLFKMHGNRTNIVLFKDGHAEELFRKNLTADMNLKLEGLDREIDWSVENFERHADDLKSVYFTFGKVVWKYLYDQRFPEKNRTEKWQAIQALLQRLEDPSYFITRIEGKPTLSLLETGVIEKVFDNPVDAANEFYHTFTHVYAISQEKTELLSLLRSKLESAKSYVEKNSVRLEEVRRDDHYRLWGDLVMANLHIIKPGSNVVTVENFYDGQQPVQIKLKKDLSPQKNAEIFYKKAKNQHIEIDRLESAVSGKQQEIADLREKMIKVEETTDMKTLRALKGQFSAADTRRETQQLPFYEFTFRDFKVWVGKNAQSNDTLTLKYSHKDDLWLHAKDVSGSHVLIKHQSGRNIPRDVIEYAASLAAYNSKRKNESLCPVIVTPKKFVRKRKGDPAGAVVVEREEIVIVEPFKPTS